MDIHTDSALVVAARDGDRQALAELLSAHLPLVHTIASRALHGHPDVDDVVQETMLRVVRALPSLREPERFRSWLVAIAVRQIRDRQRARQAHVARQQPWDGDTEPAGPDFVDGALNRLRLSVERQAILEASRWLDAGDRRVLALWWQELLGTLSRAELAGALGLTVAHTAVRIQRMRAHLTRARLILAAWRAEPRCAGLQVAARGWDGADAEPRWQKRLHRHVRGCPQCLAAGQWLAPTDTVLAHIGLLPVSAGLLEGTLTTIGTAWHAVPAGAGWWHRLVDALTAKPALTIGTATSAVTALVVVTTVLAPDGGDNAFAPPPSPAPATASATPFPAPTQTAAQTAAPSQSPAIAASDRIYLSPNGNDAGDGSADRPYASLAKAVSVVQPGQTIVARGGAYRASQPVEIATDGTPDRRITLTNAPGEAPVFDAAGIPEGKWFITQTAPYWTVRGLEIRNAPGHAYVCRSCRHNVFSRLSIHDNGGTGLLLRDAGTVGNEVLDGDFYRNHDRGGADGVAFKWGSGGGNAVRGCRFWGNVDDGLDLHEFTDPVTIDRSWAYRNGFDLWHDPARAEPGAGNGFRLGGGDPAPAVAHVVTNSASWDNAGYGFTESANRGALRLTNNSAYRNGKDGFAFFFSGSVFRHNLALANARDAVLAASAVQDGNTWNEAGWTTSALVDHDPGSAQGSRTPDGRLPTTDFLSNRRDAGVGAPMR